VRRGTLSELAAYYERSPPRGEVVIVIEGALATEPDEGAARDRARALRAAGVSARDVVRALVADQGIARNVAYRLAQEED
jgi:16S rRNA (cytidine1402-2'-O)-methyltransferase